MKKCRKARFASAQAAEAAMRRLPATATGLVPTGVYRCGKCRAWHFTSRASYSQRRRQ